MEIGASVERLRSMLISREQAHAVDEKETAERVGRLRRTSTDAYQPERASLLDLFGAARARLAIERLRTDLAASEDEHRIQLLGLLGGL